jgi:hypothetical protein
MIERLRLVRRFELGVLLWAHSHQSLRKNHCPWQQYQSEQFPFYMPNNAGCQQVVCLLSLLDLYWTLTPLEVLSH